MYLCLFPNVTVLVASSVNFDFQTYICPLLMKLKGTVGFLPSVRSICHSVVNTLLVYCKRANIRSGFISLCSRSTIFPRNLNHRDKFTALLAIVICCYMYISKFKIRKIKTTAKGPLQENREFLTPRNLSLLQYMGVAYKQEWLVFPGT